jgi:hypothetical protein
LSGQGQGKIFHLRSGRELTELIETPFGLEADLQSLLAEHPDLLPGDQIDTESPRRWLLIGQEVLVPGETSDWRLDHLFVDQDGIPTLVEVKRGSNPELRRKVLGQMLDYAANAPLHWTEGRVEALLRARLEGTGRAADDEVERLFSLPADDFWAKVEANVRERRLRLLFVTDQMAPELRRVVEFLNQSMAEVEVLAVELRQFAQGELRTIVPTVFGHTLASESKAAEKGRPWTRERFLQKLEETSGTDARRVAESLLGWAGKCAAAVWWGRGAVLGSFFPEFFGPGGKFLTFAVWTYGRVELQFQYLQNHPPFDRFEERDALRQRLNRILGESISEAQLAKRPTFDLTRLGDDTTRAAFLAEIEEVVRRVQARPNG